MGGLGRPCFVVSSSRAPPCGGEWQNRNFPPILFNRLPICFRLCPTRQALLIFNQVAIK
jgi:hypothetical protein